MRRTILIGLILGSGSLIAARVVVSKHVGMQQKNTQQQDVASPNPDIKTLYSVVDLRILPDCDSTSVSAINNKGQIVGFCAKNPHTRRSSFYAFLYDNGKMTALG